MNACMQVAPPVGQRLESIDTDRSDESRQRGAGLGQGAEDVEQDRSLVRCGRGHSGKVCGAGEWRQASGLIGTPR